MRTVTSKLLPCKSVIPLIGLILIISSCKKSADFKPAAFNEVRIYNDTLTKAESPCVNIESGYGRIFMAYGTSNVQSVTPAGPVYQNQTSSILCTDEDGRFLWKARIPDAMANNTLVPLADGGCLLATSMTFGSNSAYSANHLHLFRFDRNGNRNRYDSISFVPGISQKMAIMDIGSLKKSDGNIIIYGTCWDGGMGNWIAWALEYSLSAGLKWIKSYPNRNPNVFLSQTYLTGCVQTPDGGLLFSGSADEFDQSWNLSSRPLLFKTSSTGDSVWLKHYYSNSGIWARNLLRSPNGNYVFCFNTYNLYDRQKPTTIQLYEINAQGDSVKAMVVNNETYNSTDKIILTDNGTYFALVNQHMYNVIPAYTAYFTKNNTRKVHFDAHLKMIGDHHFQSLTSDLITKACKTSQGKFACFGLFQPIGKTYYLPQLYFLD